MVNIYFVLILVFVIVFIRIYKLRKKPTKKLTDLQLSIINKNIPLYKRLPKTLKQNLVQDVCTFIHTTRYEGAKGFAISEEIKVTIAAQACLLTLNKPIKSFKKLHTIIVYENSFQSEKRIPDQNGVITKKVITRLGESWIGGTVILSWNSTKHGSFNTSDGKNVALHEFAHQLDQNDGVGDGVPNLKNDISYTEWARILGTTYKSLHKSMKRNRKTLIDYYGGTNPAEFFAVITEVFYEKPKQLHQKHPELYDILCKFYNINPITWK